MPEYIFYTYEGYTISPNDSELDSLQILGFESGKNLKDAQNNLLENNPWIVENGFEIEEIKFKVTLSKEDLNSLSQVIDYLYKDEEKHYEESDKSEDHIFIKIKDLKNFIENN